MFLASILQKVVSSSSIIEPPPHLKIPTIVCAVGAMSVLNFSVSGLFASGGGYIVRGRVRI